MAKRTRDEAEIVESADSTAKKIRVKEEKKKKKEKKEKKAKAVDIPIDVELIGTESFAGDAVSESKPSKDERKALKRAKKEAAGRVAHQTADPVVDGTEGDEAIAKAERKARKRAEKAANKATKKAGGLSDGNLKGSPSGDDAEAVVNGAQRAEAQAYLEEKQIAIEDPLGQKVGPILSFDGLPFSENTRRAYFSDFSEPTPIQAASWPYLFNGRDMIGVAETGSGKTFAFGVPCLSKMKKDRKGIQACIVSPTRELALQIQEQMTKLATPRGLKATCVYGGMSKDDQRIQLKNTHIVVATPGRLNDFLSEGTIDLSAVRYLVLDEADRMLDKGFEQDVRKIITAATAGKDIQTLMFTATWPESIRKLAAEFLKDPVKITIGDNASGELRANTRIIQEVEVMEEFNKQGRLFEVLKQYQSGKNKADRILVFCLYKKEATRIEEFIRRKGYSVGGIHGDLSQVKRMEALEAFKKGDVPLLVATDVAARGLDIPAVKLVVNVTFPLTVEDYVHRIGRTGRAGQTGRAITFFTQTEKPLAGALINVLKKAAQPVPEELMKFGTTVKKKGHDAYGAFYKDTSDAKAATKITFE